MTLGQVVELAFTRTEAIEGLEQVTVLNACVEAYRRLHRIFDVPETLIKETFVWTTGQECDLRGYLTYFRGKIAWVKSASYTKHWTPVLIHELDRRADDNLPTEDDRLVYALVGTKMYVVPSWTSEEVTVKHYLAPPTWDDVAEEEANESYPPLGNDLDQVPLFSPGFFDLIALHAAKALWADARRRMGRARPLEEENQLAQDIMEAEDRYRAHLGGSLEITHEVNLGVYGEALYDLTTEYDRT